MVDALTAFVPGTHRSDADPAVDRSGSLPPPAAAGPTAARNAQVRPLPLLAAPVVERFDPLALIDDERRLMTLLGPPLVTTPGQSSGW